MNIGRPDKPYSLWKTLWEMFKTLLFPIISRCGTKMNIHGLFTIEWEEKGGASMRRFICAALAALYLTIPALAVEALPEESFSLSCTAAVLMERQTGTVLYEKESHRHLSPASVTKVMTLLLVAEAVENGAVSPDDPITASRRAASMGGSQIWLEEGEVMTVAEMTKCVAVVSANDCAVALAEALCGSEEAFVARMNRRAEELGLADTHFTNCTGLFEDAEHYTCAYDIAVMSRELLKHEFVRQYMTLWQDTIRAGEFGLTNTNKLVRQYNGCTGLKTGFTSTAMYCLAASAERGGVEYIAVILHGETSQLRFDAARTLLDYAFANYTLVMPETGAPDVPVSLGKAASVRAVCESSGTVLIEKARQKELFAVYELPEKVDAPVAAGSFSVRSGTLPETKPWRAFRSARRKPWSASASGSCGCGSLRCCAGGRICNSSSCK